ncbi:MAG: LCP family protein, partial [Bacillota bacterium]|nr:LCP family protein [Bacillota bacterium]
MRQNRRSRNKGGLSGFFSGLAAWFRKIPEKLAAFPGHVKGHPKRYIAIAAALVLVLGGTVAATTLIKPPAPPEEVIAEEEPEEELVGEVIDIADEANRKEGWYTFVVAGTDQGGGNTDTIMVGAYDSVNGKVNVVSIPRDTLVNVSWSVKKINAAYLHGGIDGLKNELKKIVGFAPDSYAVVDLEAFVELVDAVDGVEFNVPQDMNYSDPTQDLYINLQAGYQTLDGEQAVGLMRYRSGYADADIGRIATQQDFLKAFARKCLQIGNVTKIKTFANIFNEYVETDMSLGNIIWYGSEFLKLSASDINFHSLPANTGASVRGGSYVAIYINDWVDMINEILNPYESDITTANLNILTTRSGSLYSTTGVIAGGESSFLDYYALTGQQDPDAVVPDASLDVDGDGVADGYDLDGDGVIDSLDGVNPIETTTSGGGVTGGEGTSGGGVTSGEE